MHTEPSFLLFKPCYSVRPRDEETRTSGFQRKVRSSAAKNDFDEHRQSPAILVRRPARRIIPRSERIPEGTPEGSFARWFFPFSLDRSSNSLAHDTARHARATPTTGSVGRLPFERAARLVTEVSTDRDCP